MWPALKSVLVTVCGALTVMAAVSPAFAARPIDLSLTMSAAPEPVVSGGTITYSTDVTYYEHTPAKNVQLIQTVPTGTTIVSVSSTLGTCSWADTVVSCAIGSLSNSLPGATITVVTMAPLSAGSVQASASVTSNTFDTDLSNNQADVTTTVRQPEVSVTVTGDGIIYSSSATQGDPADISCTSGICVAGYPYGSMVTLAATPTWYASVAWSGCPALVTAGCEILLDMDKSVTATFVPNSTVRVNYSADRYARIMDAYAAVGATGSAVIQAQQFTFLENLQLDSPVSILLEGGLDASFVNAVGMTTVGKVTIRNAKVSVQRVVVR